MSGDVSWHTSQFGKTKIAFFITDYNGMILLGRVSVVIARVCNFVDNQSSREMRTGV